MTTEGTVHKEKEEQMTITISLPGKRVLVAAVAAALMLGGVFAGGWFAAPNKLSEGYARGNEDGYSTGYLDGMNGTPPDMYRPMTEVDYETRQSLGGRKLGE